LMTKLLMFLLDTVDKILLYLFGPYWL
jgi:hypothetical protein